MYSSDETSFTSASEDIGSEDTPEVSESELDISSTTISTTTSPASSAPSSPRRSPRLDMKRSRILEKDEVNFRAKRPRIDLSPPQMMLDPAPGSGDRYLGRYSPSIPSSRSSPARNGNVFSSF
ncbi:hypothetical protein CEXT_740631 [Caerostris extrusa]|uniref:Uncharacterized protein n=1 Tax=Caerostris extrusa TaxID=172846 RepID=A0AAV4MBS7_CAEEX|nr:hypothetical protein CEXT_740631 [Caerostris extrusa]